MAVVEYAELSFSGHAIRRMFERNIAVADVRTALGNGEVIMSYPDDTPYPSVLLLGYSRNRPLHVVLALNPAGPCQIITAYWPDPMLWSDDFKTRRQSP